MNPKYLTTAEAAEILRLTPWQVVNLCRAKKLAASKPSGQWLIATADLEAFIAAGSNQKASA